MSKSTIPADNGPYRDGKGTPYEGGTRVVAALSWPGHVKAGTVVGEPIHLVDMYPTIASLAGASTAKCKPLDGTNVWATIADGEPSPREEIVYGVEPFRATVRKGDWKLVWHTTLPSKAELFDLKQDPSETTNLAEKNPLKVDELKRRAEELSRGAAEPLIFKEAFDVSWRGLFGSVALPGAAQAAEAHP
jgi:arylsulfatase A-like enzyme